MAKRPKYNGKGLKIAGKPAASEACCCDQPNCCCSIFTVDPDALDEEGYFLDTPTTLYWTAGGDFTGSGTIDRDTIVGAGTSCIRYNTVDGVLGINGCGAYSGLIQIQLQCRGELTGILGFDLTWQVSTTDGGADTEGEAFSGVCEPFSITQTKEITYIIASPCDGATTRTLILTITL